MEPNPMEQVFLPDSWVLEVQATESSVCFVLEAVLQEEHPRFYWPPTSGEQYPCARLRWCLHGQVHWNDGPNLDAPATDASGEKDYGNIDVWLLLDDGKQMLEGDWGCVIVDQPTQTVVYLD